MPLFQCDYTFKSVVAPIRAVFCLLWMLAVTMGINIFVFQDGAFDFLHWAQLSGRSSGAMSWLSPAVALPILIGLGLDYDIFYTERVAEEREHGYSESVAANRALVATADLISAAGIIMVVAFLSVLLSSTESLNEIALMLIAKRGWRDLTATAQAVRTLTESPSNGIYAASFSGSWFANRFFQEGTAGAAAVYWMPHQRRAARQRLNRLRSKPAGA